MKVLLLLLAASLILAGLVLGLLSRKHRTETAKVIPWYNYGFWCNPWKLPDIYTEKGIRMHSLSLSLVMSGVGLTIAVNGLPSILG